MPTPEELEVLMERAAEAGARKALHGVGLHDENAAEDIRELRSILDGFRSARRTAWHTVVDWAVKLTLAALLLGAWIKTGHSVSDFKDVGGP